MKHTIKETHNMSVGNNPVKKVREQLEMREAYLLQLQKEKEQMLLKAPEGSLRICKHGNGTQYYARNNPKDFSGVYIAKKDFGIARGLAQKDYDQKVLDAIQKERNAIHKYLSGYPKSGPEQIYENLHKERQKLINPICETDEQYIFNWENVKYQGKVFGDADKEFYTAKGERVRSKSEVIIADALNRKGIPYRYEYPIRLKGIGTVYPDFTVLNVKERKEMYWEHLGMMDEPDYAEKALRKIACYEQNGLWQGDKLILTYETKAIPLNQKLISQMIQHYLQ